MAIIGYDGRLRPAGRALNVSAPNEFDVGAIEKISNAQPKFVEETMKLLNTFAGDAGKYGNTLARIAEEEDELKGEEAFATERRRVEKEMREIRESDSLDAGAKRAKAEDVVFNPPKTGRERFDKRLAIRGKDFIHSQLMSIYSTAKAQERHASDASFAAFTTLESANITQSFNNSMPELLSQASSIDDVSGIVDKFVSDALAGKESDVSQDKKPDYERFVAGLKADFTTQLGGAFTKQQSAEIDNSVNTVIAGASAGAADIYDVEVLAEDVLDSPEAEGRYTDTKRREKITGAMMTYTENGITRTKETMAANVVAARKVLTTHLESGDVGAFNEGVYATNTAIIETHDQLAEKTESERLAVLSSINEDERLSDEQREAYAAFVNDKYDKFIRNINKSKADSITSFKKDSELTKKKVGENSFGELQKKLRGEDVELPAGAMTVFKLLDPTKQFISEFNKEKKLPVGTLDAYLAQNYPGVSKGQALELAVLDFQYALTSIDMNNKCQKNLVAIEQILSNASIFGFDSVHYERVASFAENNIVREKNNKGEQTEAFMREYVYRGKSKSDWQDDATYKQKIRAIKIKGLLSEVPPEQWDSMAERIKTQLETTEKFDLVLTAEDAPIRVSAAKLAAEAEKTEAKAGPTPWAPLPKYVSLWKGAKIASKEAEIAYLSGDSQKTPREAEIDYWKKVAKDNGIVLFATELDTPSKAGAFVIRTLDRREEEKKKEELIAAEKKERDRLEKLLAEKYKLPLNPLAYRSHFGIGGHPINDTDEIELGPLVGLTERSKLTIEQMEDIIEQYERYESRRKAPSTEDKIRQIRAELEELKGGKK